MEYLIIIVGNFLIGGMIGLTGIAGFLLPMLYSGFLGMSSAQGLALSFFAFLISGILGAYNYYRAKNLNLKPAVWISMGSFVGAVGGVRLNLLMEEGIVKKILYLVVLLSGISILLRKDEKEERKKSRPGQKMPLWFWLAFGAVTGLICALSGAGGPILYRICHGMQAWGSSFASAFKPCKPRDWRLDWKQKYLPDSSGCAEKRCSCIFRPAGHSEIDYRLADPR